MFITHLTDHLCPDIYICGGLSEMAADLVMHGDHINVITSRFVDNIEGRVVSNESHQGVKIERVPSRQFNRSKLAGRLINEIIFCFAAYLRILLYQKN